MWEIYITADLRKAPKCSLQRGDMKCSSRFGERSTTSACNHGLLIDKRTDNTVVPYLESLQPPHDDLSGRTTIPHLSKPHIGHSLMD